MAGEFLFSTLSFLLLLTYSPSITLTTLFHLLLGHRHFALSDSNVVWSLGKTGRTGNSLDAKKQSHHHISSLGQKFITRTWHNFQKTFLCISLYVKMRFTIISFIKGTHISIINLDFTWEVFLIIILDQNAVGCPCLANYYSNPHPQLLVDNRGIYLPVLVLLVMLQRASLKTTLI